eukprot:CAMPEP_0185730874 /NCGR_PEP_ID=MMETSP1171-20130828/11236_1 /TAXON_ID=374046 /ORGANISM="Helicotheca tamensis, Strain CCMP826" /LENGTH=621 /DNA_ID=CAMNT_0028400017 /DNA_START=77 /DNA_END=1942 /DNA_ORIENTATION=+
MATEQSATKKKGGETYSVVSYSDDAEADQPNFTIDDDVEEAVTAFKDDENLSSKGTLNKAMELEEPTTRGVVQAPAYRDKYFAIAFLVQLLLVLLIAFVWGFPTFNNSMKTDNDDNGGRRMEYPKNNRYLDEGFDETPEKENGAAFSMGDLYDDDDDTFDNDFFDPNKEGSSSFGSFTTTAMVFATTFLPTIIMISIVVSPLLSFGALYLMIAHAQTLLQASLLLSVVINVLFFFIALAGDSQVATTYLILAVVFAWYAKVVWNKVPYAASTLKCAVTAVKANFGVALLALGTVPVSLGWIFFWVIGFVGSTSWGFMYTERSSASTTSSGFGDDAFSSTTETQSDLSGLGVFIGSLFILSYYWTSQVVKNSVRATVAGVIGTWWFNPSEASSFCSSAVRDSFLRANTYSLGSIAFGSLIVAIVQFIKNMVISARNRHRGSCLYLCMECLLVYIEKIANYFHKWAFVYVGLYGYGYIEAGKAVITLFEQRGFTAIISDNIVHRMLVMIGFCIGLVVGMICALVGSVFGAVEDSGNGDMAIWADVALFTGIIIGAIISSIIMGVVGNSVDAIIVCYAEAPADFKANHPALHDEMEESWSSMMSTSTLTQAAAVAVVDMETGVV